MARRELTNAQWKKLEALLDKPRTGPVTHRGDRNFIEAVFHRVRTGVPWRDLPREYGPWKSIYNRFNNWSHRGVWQEVFDELNLEADRQYMMVDGSIVRAHQDSSGGK